MAFQKVQFLKARSSNVSEITNPFWDDEEWQYNPLSQIQFHSLGDKGKVLVGHNFGF